MTRSYRDISCDCVAIVDGNWNNTLHVGTFYCNLNNTASNTNSNNGAALSCKPLGTPEYKNGIKLVPFDSGTDAEIAAMINGYYNDDLTLTDIKRY